MPDEGAQQFNMYAPNSPMAVGVGLEKIADPGFDLNRPKWIR